MTVARHVVLVAVATAGALSPARAGPTSVGERAGRAERGLLPAIVFQGEAGTPVALTDRMAYHKVPGLSVAVIDDNSIAWARGYGVARAGEVAPVTVDTVFQAGALSKSVSTVGILRLAEASGMSLDEDVNAWLQSWKVPANAFVSQEKATLRRLLSHTAGVNLDGFAGYSPGEPIPTLRQLLDGVAPARNAAVAVEAVPGSRFRPSGGAFLIAEQLVRDLARQPFDAWAKTAVFDKLRMDGSSFAQPLPEGWRARAASGHSDRGEKLAGDWKVYPEQAAAGLWTTPSDLARLMLEISSAATTGRDGKVLSAAAARQMLTEQTAGMGLAGGMGLGVQVSGSDRGEHFSQAGRNSGYDALMVMYPRAGQGAVIMINGNNNDGLVGEVLQSIAREYRWPDYKPATQREVRKVDPELLKTYEGHYGAEGSQITVRADGHRLFLEARGVGRLDLLPEADGSFIGSRLPLRVAFKKVVAGRPSVLEVVSGSSRQEALRVDEPGK
jgi:CubicO group peptidase (beta-lactamase class C family)